tara:strand:- start:5429 stop:6031 length:603 start_codon:yes stop_codon:yes gene_type:complete
MGLLSLIPCPQVGPKVVDTFFTIISVSSGALGTILIVISSQLTGIAFIMVAIFSGVSLFSIKRMRLRASVQKSVNVLKQENDELKENNDELKENVDELENNLIQLKTIETTLKEDVNALKSIVGLIGDNSQDAIEEIKIILKNLKQENIKHSILVKRQFLTYMYGNEKLDIKIFKDVLLELYSDLEWKAIEEKVFKKEFF